MVVEFLCGDIPCLDFQGLDTLQPVHGKYSQGLGGVAPAVQIPVFPIMYHALWRDCPTGQGVAGTSIILNFQLNSFKGGFGGLIEMGWKSGSAGDSADTDPCEKLGLTQAP